MQEKITLVTKSNAAEKQNIEDSIPSAVSSDEYLKRLGNPSPPKIKQYDHLLSTPPPPEITRIPDDVLQVSSVCFMNSFRIRKVTLKGGCLASVVPQKDRVLCCLLKCVDCNPVWSSKVLSIPFLMFVVDSVKV